ncbi:hypothetical protein BKA65DRAFT_293316 [Rhexocercosporidium sp. MPI-PUGE-AT-0058]|nr:hypothetical protein BKA65DRAFT_293316 [Rhexocercosporidium sp. MPI-PUGE-AT-0058]
MGWDGMEGRQEETPLRQIVKILKFLGWGAWLATRLAAARPELGRSRGLNFACVAWESGRLQLHQPRTGLVWISTSRSGQNRHVSVFAGFKSELSENCSFSCFPGKQTVEKEGREGRSMACTSSKDIPPSLYIQRKRPDSQLRCSYHLSPSPLIFACKVHVFCDCSDPPCHRVKVEKFLFSEIDDVRIFLLSPRYLVRPLTVGFHKVQM